jgi:predicted phosphoribosyltransferase
LPRKLFLFIFTVRKGGNMFRDRKHAGMELGKRLREANYDRDAFVIAIPKGGIEVGIEAARVLDADFSVMVVRKLPFPHNPESGFGAMAEDGSVFILNEFTRELGDETIESIRNEQQGEINQRIELFDKYRPPLALANRKVILVDDGLAMGSTMSAALQMCRKQEAAEVTVAVPVAGERAVRRLEKKADRLIVLEKPPFFRAVAEVYERWHDVSDEEAIMLLS